MICGYVSTGTILEGIPPFEPPPFSTQYQNVSYNFQEMTQQYGTSLAFIPLVAVLEAVAIAKAFGEQTVV